jgi:Glycosyltransferase like family 2
MTTALWAIAAAVAMLTGHAAVNARMLRRPGQAEVSTMEPVAVLLPVRDEADRVGACLTALLAQRGVPQLQILVLDDGSADATAGVVRSTAAGDPRVRLIDGPPPPTGWLGKPYACAQLAAACPQARILVFVDADVVLAPTAVASAVDLLSGADLVSPYPRLVAESPAERLVQPLLPWLWLTFLPLRAMERSSRPSLAAAGGQFLVLTRAAYERAGGHAAVRGQVLEDLALARAVKRTGGRIALADGSRLARCRMYSTWAQLSAGYRKSLWAAGGSPVASLALVAFLCLLYVVPPLVALAGLGLARWWWLLAGGSGYGVAVVGRMVSARANGARFGDTLAHPAGVMLLTWLTLASVRGHRRKALTWKGRALP